MLTSFDLDRLPLIFIPGPTDPIKPLPTGTPNPNFADPPKLPDKVVLVPNAEYLLKNCPLIVIPNPPIPSVIDVLGSLLLLKGSSCFLLFASVLYRPAVDFKNSAFCSLNDFTLAAFEASFLALSVAISFSFDTFLFLPLYTDSPLYSK